MEYKSISMIPFKSSCCVDTKRSALLKNAPTHGVQLIDNSNPNNTDLKKFNFLAFLDILFVLFKKFIFNIL